VRLGRHEYQTPVGTLQRLPNEQHLTGQVDIRPAQPQQLAAPQPGRQRQDEQPTPTGRRPTRQGGPQAGRTVTRNPALGALRAPARLPSAQRAGQAPASVTAPAPGADLTLRAATLGGVSCGGLHHGEDQDDEQGRAPPALGPAGDLRPASGRRGNACLAAA
jgi:hypothetical protein